MKNILKRFDISSKNIFRKKLIENDVYGEFYDPQILRFPKLMENIKKHLIKDFKAFNKDGSVNAAIEKTLGLKRNGKYQEQVVI